MALIVFVPGSLLFAVARSADLGSARHRGDTVD
jgi:hypothetical protein